jgi:5-methylcytosine-specific restriction endonuclease McrA
LYQRKPVRNCLECNASLATYPPNQLRCGGQTLKGSCAWKHARISWHRSSPEKLKELALKYRHRAKRKKNQRRLKLRFEVFQRDNFTCQYCGRKAPEVILHPDHKYPESKGGQWTLENLITSCLECKIGKQDMILTEFIK